MKKIKVLTITTSGLKKKEGILTIVLDYYSYFDRSKYVLDIVADGVCDEDVIHSIIKSEINIKYLPSRKNSTLRYIKSLIRLFKTEKYDVLYIHGSSSIMCIDLFIAKICGCKKRIVHSHNTSCNHPLINRLLRPIFYKSYTTALACGEQAGIWLYGKNKFTVIKNGRDVEKYKFKKEIRDSMRKKLNLEDDVMAIGHVGNFNEQKNQKFIIAVLNEIIKKTSNVKLYLIGTGYTKEIIENLVKENDLSNYVEFTGSINNVPDMLQAMDVMLLPSLYEGVPLVAIEWQICGLPCIISENVSKECKFTSLVTFLSLESSFKKWANELLNTREINRFKESEKAIKNAKNIGFDLITNSSKLESFFRNK